MTTEQLSDDWAMVALERLLSANSSWAPHGSRLDPYEGVEDDAMRNWMWMRIRAHVLARDNWTCQMCGSYTNGSSQLHHIIFKCHNGTDAPQNLMTTCARCHKAIHARKARICDLL
jgi:5-methylcytosine-specific restriction endonuclease McrA